MKVCSSSTSRQEWWTTARSHSAGQVLGLPRCYRDPVIGQYADGVDALLDGLERYLPAPQYSMDFGARVFKIARDAQGNRLSYLKITGGALSVREQLSGGEDGGCESESVDITVDK